MMSAPLMEVMARVLDTIAGFPQLFCFIEVDATLGPPEGRPEGAPPLATTAALLRSLLGAPGTSVAIVSDRPIAEVAARLAVDGAHYIGMHGLETRLPNGETTTMPGVEAIRAAMPEIRAELEREIGPRAGIVLEDKGVSLACHSRRASRADAAAVRWSAAAVTRRHRARGTRVGLREGREMVEIRCDFADNGRAVRALLGPGGAALLPLYAGDDATDEDGLASLPPYAITIHLGGPGERSRARYRLADALEMHAFLAAVARCRLR